MEWSVCEVKGQRCGGREMFLEWQVRRGGGADGRKCFWGRTCEVGDKEREVGGVCGREISRGDAVGNRFEDKYTICAGREAWVWGARFCLVKGSG